MSSPFGLGFGFTFGAVAAATLLAVAVKTVTGSTESGRDATDPPAPFERSGMSLFTDHGSGCRYVAVPLSGMTPRLRRDGKPDCPGTPE